MFKIVLISGKSGHGKDTFAANLTKELEEKGYLVKEFHFADSLKHFLRDYCGWDGEKDVRGRQLLQEVGTELVGTESTIWADNITQYMRIAFLFFKEQYKNIVFIVPDLRFRKELFALYSMFRSANVITVRLNRLNEDRTPYVNPEFTDAQLKHISETNLDNYTKFMYNYTFCSLEENTQRAAEFAKEIYQND